MYIPFREFGFQQRRAWERAMLSWQHVHAAVKALRWIFIGGILWIVDVKFNSFDVLDDTVGTLLITFGVFRLARAPVGGKYRKVMTFVQVIAVASVVETASKHFALLGPAILLFPFGLLGLCQLAAIILFCLAMRWFCEEAALPQVARSWWVTFLLFCLIYALPLGFSYLASMIATSAESPFHINVGPVGLLLLLPVFLAPLVHLFVSTSRMRRAAEAALAGQLPPPGGFPVIFPPRDPPVQARLIRSNAHPAL